MPRGHFRLGSFGAHQMVLLATTRQIDGATTTDLMRASCERSKAEMDSQDRLLENCSKELCSRTAGVVKSATATGQLLAGASRLSPQLAWQKYLLLLVLFWGDVIGNLCCRHVALLTDFSLPLDLSMCEF
mmetsp:Transcript_63708/g.126037  ORF Transcript_63708/g.126037 Transcript_63708/m.126037 type:complete len:130 (+) Transcript_63708:222-611(+)